MKNFLLFSASLLLVGSAPLSAADSVELNGITCLPGEKLACLLLYQPARSQPLNFTLAEGESRFGFKLLAVDAGGHRVLVEKCGVKKYVRIGSAPDWITPAKPDSTLALTPPIAPDASSVTSHFASEDWQRLLAGNPVVPGTVAGVIGGAGKSSIGGQNAATGAGNAGQNAGVGSNDGASVPGTSGGTAVDSSAASASQNSDANQLWYQESMSIEQSRAMTADAVLNGSMTPFPRTPLTPPGTPAQLVSPEVYFANYIPGYKVIGFLNQ